MGPHLHAPATQVPALPALQLASPLHPQALPVQAKPGGQMCPQAPQFAASVAKFLQPAEQQVALPPQAAPPLQLHSA